MKHHQKTNCKKRQFYRNLPWASREISASAVRNGGMQTLLLVAGPDLCRIFSCKRRDEGGGTMAVLNSFLYLFKAYPGITAAPLTCYCPKQPRRADRGEPRSSPPP